MGFRPCLPFSLTTLRGKHCWHPIDIIGVVDTFRLGRFSPSPTSDIRFWKIVLIIVCLFLKSLSHNGGSKTRICKWKFMCNVTLDFGLQSFFMVNLSEKFERCLFPYPNMHELRTPHEAIFHRNLKLLGLGRQIGKKHFGTFEVFSADLSALNLVLWVPCPLINWTFISTSQIFIWDCDLNLGRQELGI